MQMFLLAALCDLQNRKRSLLVLFCLGFQLSFYEAPGAQPGFSTKPQTPKPQTRTVEIYEGQTLERYCYFGTKMRPSLGAGWRTANPIRHLSEESGRVEISFLPRFVILRIPSIQKRDEGILECVNNDGKIVHRLKLVVRDTPLIRLTLDRSTGVVGESAKFSCFFDADIEMFMFWFHNGKVVHASLKYIVRSHKNGMTLRITSLEQSDKGTVSCRAITDRFNSTNVMATRVLEVESLPSVSVSPMRVKTYIGAKVTFFCNVSGDPKPNITWFQMCNGSNKALSMKQELTLLHVLKSSCERYTCIAQNIHGVRREAVRLKVKEHALKIENVFGSTLFLPCPSIRGKPLPEERMKWWYKSGDNTGFVEKHYTVVLSLKRGFGIVIKNVTEADSGMYKCIWRGYKSNAVSQKTFIVRVQSEKPDKPKVLICNSSDIVHESVSQVNCSLNNSDFKAVFDMDLPGGSINNAEGIRSSPSIITFVISFLIFRNLFLMINF